MTKGLTKATDRRPSDRDPPAGTSASPAALLGLARLLARQAARDLLEHHDEPQP